MPFAGFGLHPNPKVEYGGVVQKAIFSSPTKSLNKIFKFKNDVQGVLR
jgi:hypothetical protein